MSNIESEAQTAHLKPESNDYSSQAPSKSLSVEEARGDAIAVMTSSQMQLPPYVGTLA